MMPPEPGDTPAPSVSFGVPTAGYPFRFDVIPEDYKVVLKVGKELPLVIHLTPKEATALGRALVGAANVLAGREEVAT